MSEDRTQPPSQRRRQLAREQGQAAHSPELTAAAGWLAAVVALGCCGGDLAGALVGLLRGALEQGDLATMPVDPSGLADRIRAIALALAWPLGVVLAAFAAGATAAHQCQVRGLWSGRHIMPDAGRLWTPGRGLGMSSRAWRTGWSAIKAAVFVAALAGVIRAGWGEVLTLGSLEREALAREASRSVLRLAGVLAGVLAALGLADYGLSYWRFESMLRTTPEERREDQRVLEGDVTARAQRRRLARAWRGDAPELLAGASLALHGSGGLTLILSGGPPPRRVTIRAAARTAAGLRLRRSAEAAKIPHVEEAGIAQRLAQHPAGLPVAAELIAELAAIWPASPAA
jgi:flagellar biosynthesis protein FlhB